MDPVTLLVGVGLGALALWGGDDGSAPGPSPKPDPDDGRADDPPANLPSEADLLTLLCLAVQASGATRTDPELAANAFAAAGISGPWPGASQWRRDLFESALDVLAGIRGGTVACPQPGPNPYVPSIKKCPRTGKPYNAALWPTPDAVILELAALGFGENLERSDSLSGPGWRGEVARFQAIARGLGLTGWTTAKASDIDGIVGACTLLGLTDARSARLAGSWPFALVRDTPPVSLAKVPPAPPVCAQGTYPKWTGSGWVCQSTIGKETIKPPAGPNQPLVLELDLSAIGEAEVREVLFVVEAAAKLCKGKLNRKCLATLAEQIKEKTSG